MTKQKPSLESCLGSPLSFYGGTVTLRFAKDPYHQYFREACGALTHVDGVTSACGIIDKSQFLVPWSAKMTAEKLLRTMPKVKDELGIEYIDSILWTDFETLVLEAKKAHKEKLVDASDVGSAAHAWLEDSIRWAITFNNGKVEKLTEQEPNDHRAKNCGLAALDWMQKHSVKWISTERVVYSKEHNYAGTMDGKAIVDGVLSIVDWKSSNALRSDYCLQTSAYQHADIEEFGVPIPDRHILRLGKEKGDFEPWHLGPGTIADDFEAFRLCLTLERAHDKLNARIAAGKQLSAIKKKKEKNAKS